MNIDITKIENYADMTPEQKIEALEKFEYDDNSSALEEANKKIKGLESKGALFDKVSSELAALKKEKREKMTEDEKAKADSDALARELQELKDASAKRDKIDSVLATYSKYGMDRATAEKFVEEGDQSIITQLIDAHTQKLLDEQKDKEKDPNAGHSGGGNNDNKFKPQTFNKSLDLEGLEKLAIK